MCPLNCPLLPLLPPPPIHPVHSPAEARVDQQIHPHVYVTDQSRGQKQHGGE